MKVMFTNTSVFVNLILGMAYCGVIGHTARKYYAIIGPPVDKVMKIMIISYAKVILAYEEISKKI